MDAKSLVNWKIISTVLTGNGNTVRVDRPNKKYGNEINSLLDYVQDWIDRKGVMGEVKVTAVITEKSVYDGFTHKYEMQDEVPNIPKEQLSKIWDDVKPKILDYIVVDSLPKDRKAMTEEGYRGLYSSGKKFYTNKIIENRLDIREWSDLKKAKEYLDSLKNKEI